jgi:hypothetical protein
MAYSSSGKSWAALVLSEGDGIFGGLFKGLELLSDENKPMTGMRTSKFFMVSIA